MFVSFSRNSTNGYIDATSGRLGMRTDQRNRTEPVRPRWVFSKRAGDKFDGDLGARADRYHQGLRSGVDGRGRRETGRTREFIMPLEIASPEPTRKEHVPKTGFAHDPIKHHSQSQQE